MDDNSRKKEVKPVLVAYTNIGELENTEDIREYLKKINDSINFDEYHVIVVPVRDRETTIECINPSFATEQEKEDISAFIERADQAIHEFFKNKTAQ